MQPFSDEQQTNLKEMIKFVMSYWIAYKFEYFFIPSKSWMFIYLLL